MANWTTSIITLDKQYADLVLPVICPNGVLDFTHLFPLPEDEQNRVRAKNVSECSYFMIREHEVVFDVHTVWGPPTLLFDTFAERFKIPFTVRYADECANFWGINTYTVDSEGKVHNEERYCHREDFESFYGEECRPDYEACSDFKIPQSDNEDRPPANSKSASVLEGLRKEMLRRQAIASHEGNQQ